MELHALSSDRKKLKRIITRYDRTWPMYLVHDNVSLEYWEQAMDSCGDFQFVVFDNDKSIATVNSIPQIWDGNPDNLPKGWDDALETGVKLAKSGKKPNTLCALAVTIGKTARGGGKSLFLLKELKNVARARGYEYFIVAVRPTFKTFYPLLSMREYVQWTNEKGEMYDPWIRTHLKANSEIIKVQTNSMRVEANIENWEKWTGLRFQHSGNYVIPRGLSTLAIDVKKNLGIYIEDNVWMAEKIK